MEVRDVVLRSEVGIEIIGVEGVKIKGSCYVSVKYFTR